MKSNTYLSAIVIMLFSCNISSASDYDISDAAFNGKIKEVKELVKKGADVNKKDKHGSRPLIRAVQSQVYTVVEFLLSNGANVNALNSFGQSALSATCEMPTWEENGTKLYNIAKLLTQKGANVNLVDGDGISLIKYCIESEADKRVIQLLKSKGAH